MSELADRSSPSSEGEALLSRIQEALAKAVREALRGHKLAGNPVAIWRDGRVVWIEPSEIPDLPA